MIHACFYTMIDIDECVPGASNCDENANCANYLGSFTCACHSGFVGNGLNGNCTGTLARWNLMKQNYLNFKC